MIRYGVLVLGVLVNHIWGAMDCDFMKQEQMAYGGVMPVLIRDYGADAAACTPQFDPILVRDYTQLDTDVALAYVYVGLRHGSVHPLLLDYTQSHKRWDLLLMIITQSMTLPRSQQMGMVQYLYYADIPNYIRRSLQHVMEQWRDSERMSVAQQLRPHTADRLRYVGQYPQMTYPYWSTFDRWVFLYYLHQLYPGLFESFSDFWNIQWASQNDGQNPEMAVMMHLWSNRSATPSELTDVSPSLQAFYYMKRGDFDQATPLIQDTAVFFNLLQYVLFYTAAEQQWLLTAHPEFTLSDRDRLHTEFAHHMIDGAFQTWANQWRSPPPAGSARQVHPVSPPITRYDQFLNTAAGIGYDDQMTLLMPFVINTPIPLRYQARWIRFITPHIMDFQ
jgi:hypothetical protein